jgi:hypothetical protein
MSIRTNFPECDSENFKKNGHTHNGKVIKKISYISFSITKEHYRILSKKRVCDFLKV